VWNGEELRPVVPNAAAHEVKQRRSLADRRRSSFLLSIGDCVSMSSTLELGGSRPLEPAPWERHADASRRRSSILSSVDCLSPGPTSPLGSRATSRRGSVQLPLPRGASAIDLLHYAPVSVPAEVAPGLPDHQPTYGYTCPPLTPQRVFFDDDEILDEEDVDIELRDLDAAMHDLSGKRKATSTPWPRKLAPCTLPPPLCLPPADLLFAAHLLAVCLDQSGPLLSPTSSESEARSPLPIRRRRASREPTEYTIPEHGARRVHPLRTSSDMQPTTLRQPQPQHQAAQQQDALSSQPRPESASPQPQQAASPRSESPRSLLPEGYMLAAGILAGSLTTYMVMRKGGL
jgi:hypothetical protein